MGESNEQSLEEQVRKLREDMEALRRCPNLTCTGGMLSNESFRGDRVVHRGSVVKLPDDDQEYGFEECLQWFKNREWDKVGNRIIIDPYDEDYVTPFSYDLSLGPRVFSVRPRKRVVQGLPYDLHTGETAIVFTEQFIALPPVYAATVWPRFAFVLQGVFQSMVKIDPTWYGNLGVAVTNLSPRAFSLKRGKRFGTLILYGLASRTDVDLWHPDQLEDLEVSAPLRGLPGLNAVSKKLSKDDYRGVAWIDGQSLKARGLKSSTYEQLKNEDPNPIWRRAVDEVWEAWKGAKKNGRGIEGMSVLGMTSLEAIVPEGDAPAAVDLTGLSVTEKDLRQAAEEYGRPFDLVYGLPGMLERDVRKAVTQQLDAELGRTVYPNVVALVLRIISVLGLGVGLIALLITFMTYSTAEPGKPTASDMQLQKLILWGIILFGVLLFLLSITMTRKDGPGLLRRFGARCYRLLGEVGTCLSGRAKHRRHREGTDERE